MTIAFHTADTKYANAINEKISLVLIVNEATGQERGFSSMFAAARFINVGLLKFTSSTAWFRNGDCPTDALGRRSRIVVLDGVVEGGQQVFPAGPARITIMGDRTETAAEARRQNYINCCDTRLQVRCRGSKSRLGLFLDENDIPIYRTFDFEQDLPANSLAIATDLSYLDGLLADGSMNLHSNGGLVITWAQAREQPLRMIAEANAHRGATFTGPYANGFRQDGSQCVIYHMCIRGKKAQQLLEDVLRESACFEWMLQKKRMIELLLSFSREKAGLDAQGRRRLISYIRRRSRQLRPAAWNDWAQLEEDGDLELVEDAEDVVEGSDDEDVLLAPSGDEEGSGSDEEGDEDDSMAGSSASDTGSEEEDESEGGSSASDDGSGYEDEAEDEDEGDAMEST
ncbi:hypothetical protein C2E21_5538 isoform B [Chlorella sorokiniana]|uniref:Uncharacterized protein n=1 Tax=Chlorella sorokiniana TaxID=3076 RepID=A0A2P6TNS7_CHLSO|nr:hypothetical protein C2E21_5538 isoform B [Chlorella sorokiniana]|eukprot:PRW50986.1 hypothetical protein C2E21_5538 isoform B [Chlorella sorokiniana]